jgi:hypothetical protein
MTISAPTAKPTIAALTTSYYAARDNLLNVQNYNGVLQLISYYSVALINQEYTSTGTNEVVAFRVVMMNQIKDFGKKGQIATDNALLVIKLLTAKDTKTGRVDADLSNAVFEYVSLSLTAPTNHLSNLVVINLQDRYFSAFGTVANVVISISIGTSTGGRRLLTAGDTQQQNTVNTAYASIRSLLAASSVNYLTSAGSSQHLEQDSLVANIYRNAYGTAFTSTDGSNSLTVPALFLNSSVGDAIVAAAGNVDTRVIYSSTNIFNWDADQVVIYSGVATVETSNSAGVLYTDSQYAITTPFLITLAYDTSRCLTTVCTARCVMWNTATSMWVNYGTTTSKTGSITCSVTTLGTFGVAGTIVIPTVPSSSTAAATAGTSTTLTLSSTASTNGTVSDPSSSSSSIVGPVVGGVVGGVAAIVIIILLIVYREKICGSGTSDDKVKAEVEMNNP